VKLMPHTHPEDRIYTVISGVFYIGLGDRFDGDQVNAYPPGAVIVLPGAHRTSIGLNPASTLRRSPPSGRLASNIWIRAMIRVGRVATVVRSRGLRENSRVTDPGSPVRVAERGPFSAAAGIGVDWRSSRPGSTDSHRKAKVA
jgi:hypothetical protein